LAPGEAGGGGVQPALTCGDGGGCAQLRTGDERQLQTGDERPRLKQWRRRDNERAQLGKRRLTSGSFMSMIFELKFTPG
jgi:hypothetical protein